MRTFSERFIKSGNFSLLLFSVGLLAIFASIGVSGIEAQKRKSTKKVVTKKTPVKKKIKIQSISNFCIPPKSDYISVLQLDKNSNLTVTVQTKDNSKVLFNAKPMASLKEVLSGIDKKSTVTIKADPTLSFDSVVKVLASARRIINSCINVEASTKAEDPYVYIPSEPTGSDKMIAKPNPLTLVVTLDKNGNITLNNEEHGSLNDTSNLTNILRQIFKDREYNGVVREGTNIIETTVFIKAVTSSKFGDVIKIVDAVKEAGASLVGLQIDNLQGPVEFQIEVTKP